MPSKRVRLSRSQNVVDRLKETHRELVAALRAVFDAKLHEDEERDRVLFEARRRELSARRRRMQKRQTLNHFGYTDLIPLRHHATLQSLPECERRFLLREAFKEEG
jgi:hypothetical protein